MKISLREARKLDQRIQAKINKGIVTGRALNIHEAFLDSVVDTEGWLAETTAMGDESVLAIVGLIAARATIRRFVQATNEEVGINELVSQRKLLITTRSIWNDVVNAYDIENGHAMTPEVLARAASAAVESSKNSSRSSSIYGGRTDTITVSSVSDESYEQAEARVRSLLRDIDGVEDKIAGLNATVKIELESTLVDLLQEEDLL